jgi:hypothetical protein
MKNCDKFKRLMSEFLDGELRGTLKSEFEEHIKGCRVCSDAVTRLQNIRSSLHRLSPIKTSPDFDAMLRARIRLTSSARWRNYGGRDIVVPWRIPALALGTILVVIVAALSITMLTNQRQNLASSPDIKYLSDIRRTQPLQDVDAIPTNYIMDHVLLEDFLLGNGVPLNSANFRNTKDAQSDTLVKPLQNGNKPRGRVVSDKTTMSF